MSPARRKPKPGRAARSAPRRATTPKRAAAKRATPHRRVVAAETRVGVLLAAGASERMGSPKPLKRVGRETFTAHGIRNLWHACGTVIVVLGSGAPAVRRAVEREFEALLQSGRLQRDLAHAHQGGQRGLEVHFIVNPRWRQGMFTSVCAGLAEALVYRPDAVMVLPVDHPSVHARTVAGIASELRDTLAGTRGLACAVVPRFQGRRGHPVALSPALARAVVKDRVADNLSEAIKRNARRIEYLDVTDAGVVRNRNRPGD